MTEQFGYGITFDDLYERDGLVKLDAAFVGALAGDVALHNRFMAARADRAGLSEKEHSQLLIDVAPHVEDFIGALFGIGKEIGALAERHHTLAPLYACKRLFVQRRAAKALPMEQVEHMDGNALLGMLPLVPVEDAYFELVFAKVVMGWLEKEEEHKSLLEIAARYAAWALYSTAGRKQHAQGILFKAPKKLDPFNLIAVDTEERDGVQVMRLPHHHLRARDGFKLTDDGGTLAQALDQANYCIFCHNQSKDSCSKGMREKGIREEALGIRENSNPIPNAQSLMPSFKKNALDITLNGCPLEERISEMNLLKSEGVPLGALAMVVVDNPMCAGTGHRICNDCMKSCIYQKQEPVNIPLVETHTLRDVLQLPYGFEIYSLLTRWNPLNLERPIPRAQSGYKVLVAGLGPSGYTLAHHLMNDGHTVVAVDGLKIEPVAESICGVDALGNRVKFAPIKDIAVLYEALDERSLAGFGGVAEYGITVRWDKNYLKIIRLLLERRTQFAMMGGVRFGSSLTYDNAFAMGFDHVALCMGAGRPTLIDMPNGLARGVRTASDFLMALQLTGAGKKDSIANLQLRLPVVVIGGGLTAVDTATESLAYYPVQVEKFLSRYEMLVAERGEASVRAAWSEEDAIIAEEFLAHGRAIREEKRKANPDVWSLLDQWGGVKLVYRKRLIDAPSYRLNHEEVEKAFEEGIFFAELFEPTGIEVDRFGYARAITLKKAGTENQSVTIPARSILIAAGTNPNTVLQREDPQHFELDGKYFTAVDEEGAKVRPQRVAKPDVPQVLMSINDDGKAISFFGDLHPSFAGNVVKAMGSAKQGYPVVSRVLARRTPSPLEGESRGGGVTSIPSMNKIPPLPNPPPQGGRGFLEFINLQLRAKVHAVNRLTPTIIEVVIHAPLAAARFEPGQFYRLQNFEAFAPRVDGVLPTTLAMEGLAMTGAWVDKAQGLISVIALEMGGSSDLCAHLKPGEPVVLMGPTGTATHIEANEQVMLVGGGLGNAVLFSIGKAMRDKGSKVLYFAGYKKAADRYKIEEIEQAADVIVWCCDDATFTPGRAQDMSFQGNIVEAIAAYGEGKLGIRDQALGIGEALMPNAQSPIPLSTIQRIIAIGSDRMMAAVASARHGVLHPHLNPAHVAIGSINSPMQCMMKEICAQCLQKHVDPVTGEETYVYSCFNQDQPLDSLSWAHLSDRLKQNSVQEKLTAQWVDACLKQLQWRQPKVSC
jgi:NADPH-dependent glutamate synthase beta subunit-like oxidoreductase/NAD(P)H-flavin reductase